VLLVQPCPANSPEVQRRGLRLALATSLRRNPVESLNPAWKTGNYLNNIMGLREARARGADEVLMLNLRGEITEASTSNVAFVGPDGVVTPRLEEGILGGITRALVVQRIAPAAGVPVHERVVRPEDLAGMRECFLLSTTKDLSPVAAIDETRFQIGADTVTARLSAAFAAYTRESAAAHPQWRV
jgi:branched-chain amino acid aminotransferase